MYDRNQESESNIIEVTNVSPSATLEQMSTFFGTLGDIVTIELIQPSQCLETYFKVCFVEFAESSSVLMAHHLTNTIFIDRCIVVLPFNGSKIPSSDAISEESRDSFKYVTNFNPGVMSHVVNGPGGVQMIATIDSRLAALGLSPYPLLPINTDPTRLEEIRRTIYIGNLDSTVPPDHVMKFFNDIGEVKFIRMAGDDTQPTRFAFVEYTHQSSIANILPHNGSVLGGRPLKINHSNNSIVKPPPRVDDDELLPRKRRSNSRDYIGPREKYQTSRDSRDRSRDRSYRTDRAKSPSRRHRSRSPHDVSARFHDRKRDRISGSRYSKSKSNDRSDTKRRSRSPRNERRKRSRSRSRDRERSRHHKSRR